ncbi:MAG: homoserine O-succinyltransferase [Bacteriovoracaceae bacterium]|nr:homoserine O-succinyltransferase [Bacteriovoracaceae bacterium]
MKVNCITHADFEGPGVISDWAQSCGHHFSIYRPFKSETLGVDAPEGDLLILMGGPQSPLQLSKFPYLEDEIKLIQHYLKANKPILGFCLGAQLIGEALGAKTEKSPEKEMGVFPIYLTKEGKQDPLLQGFASEVEAIHWHNDMPGLTKNSVILATSPGCPRQIVKYKHNVYGLQCHLEIARDGIQDLIEACPDDLSPSKFTQTKDSLLENNYSAINQLCFKLLERLSGFQNLK